MKQRSALYRSEGLRYKKEKIDESKKHSFFVERQQLRTLSHFRGREEII